MSKTGLVVHDVETVAQHHGHTLFINRVISNYLKLVRYTRKINPPSKR